MQKKLQGKEVVMAADTQHHNLETTNFVFVYQKHGFT
jgi:hypothetical protein